MQVKPQCCWYTGSEGWFYTGSGLSVTCMQMYEHEEGGGLYRPWNFRNNPGISHAFQEFLTPSRGISQTFQTYCTRKRDSTRRRRRKFSLRNYKFHWHSGKNFMRSGKFAFLPGILHAFKENLQKFREFGKFSIQP